MFRKKSIESTQALIPWIEVIVGVNEVCDPSYDGMSIEEYKILLLGNIALDHHKSGATRTVIGAKLEVAKVLNSTAREYEGFPVYDRIMLLHDEILGTVLGCAFSVIREYRILKDQKEYIEPYS